MRARVVAVLAAIAAAFTGAVIAAPSAQAGTLCNLSYTLFCGEVYNASNSGSYITVTTTWPTITARYVAAGNNSRAMGIKDVDGFYAPSGWCVTDSRYGNRFPTGWNKITDLDTMYLRTRDC